MQSSSGYRLVVVIEIDVSLSILPASSGSLIRLVSLIQSISIITIYPDGGGSLRGYRGKEVYLLHEEYGTDVMKIPPIYWKFRTNALLQNLGKIHWTLLEKKIIKILKKEDIEEIVTFFTK